MRKIVSLAGFGACLTACMLHGTDARADVSSWLSAGGGYGLQRSDARSTLDRAPALSFAVGVGSSPLSSIVLGGILRSTTYLSLGTDLQLSLRLASGGFARGQWGVAADIGPGARLWRDSDHGRFPIGGMILLGAPWGLQVGAGAQVAKLGGSDPSALGFVALLEIDLLRLTVMRQGATDRWWENPSPAGGQMK